MTSSKPDPDDIINYLILVGAVEVSGIDPKTGEFLYAFTNTLEKLDPRMFARLVESFHQNMLKLWELGFLEINMLEDNPTVRITPKVFNDDALDKLDIEVLSTLKEIMNMMRR